MAQVDKDRTRTGAARGRRMTTTLGRTALGVALWCAALAAGAQGAAPARDFDIAGGDLKAALDAYTAQAQVQLIYKIDDVRGKSTRGVKRSASPEEALAALLEGTALTVRRDSSGALVITGDPAKKDAAGATPAEADASLGTVVVYASRRREPMREVPMQVGVVTEQKLQRKGARSLQDYVADEPGVDVISTGGAGLGTLSIRGVSTGLQTISTVGTYIDDVAFGSSSAYGQGPQMALDMALLDLNHIEILRGPQGTLYGAGAMGGLLKYVTNEPDTYELQGKLTLGASVARGGKASTTLGAVVNVPLSEDVAGMRIAAFTEKIAGSIDTVGPIVREHVDDGRTSGARVTLLLQPTSRFKARLTATMQKIRRDGTDLADYSAATSSPVDGPRLRKLWTPEPYDVRVRLFSADLEYDFGWARLNSITSRQLMDSAKVIDFSGAYVPLLAGMGLNLQSVGAGVNVSLGKTTQELRLTSKADKRFEWLAGFYYDREVSGNDQAIGSVMPGGAAGPDLLLAAMPSTFKETAAYGDVTVKFDPGLAITGGLRVARNKQHYSQAMSGLMAGGDSTLTGDSSDSSTTWLLTARQSLTSNSDVYLRAATGYRPGGPNAVLRDATTGEPAAPPTFQPDKLTSLEAGYKADLLDKTLSLEAALYDIRWDKVQQYMPVNGLNVIANAGEAHIQGAELALTWRPTRDWTFSGNASWIDARLSEDAPGLGAKDGARLPSSAKFSATASVNYAFSVMGRPAFAGWSQRYVGDRTAGFEGSPGSPLYRLPSYSLSDLQFGVELGRTTLSAYVRNVFDKPAQASALGVLQPLGAPTWISVVRPRTVGVTLNLVY